MKKLTTYLLVFLIGLLIGFNIAKLNKPKYLVIQKSSDSSWELSDKDFRDTVTIDTIYFNNLMDTVYRTIEYKRIAL